MRSLRTLSIAALLGAAALACSAATPVFKCVVNGTTTYQKDPCPTAAPRKAPDLERLNAEEKKRRGATPAAPADDPAVPASGGTPAAAPAPAAAFRCDGRTHCSQMRSCAEAKYFLAHCPGVKMDGNRDGIPCEQQWCTR